MKRIIAFLLSVLIVILVSFGVSAADTSKKFLGDKVVIKDSNWAYEKVNSYGYEIDEYIGAGAEPELPYTFAKQYVNSIGSYAFNENTVISKVKTTPVLNTIGDYAFNGCTSLEKVELFNSISSIGVGCFYGDSALTDINLEDTSITEVSAYCFAECGFNKIALPYSCESIGNYAFYNCSNLTEVIIPKTVSSISSTAFDGTSNLTVYCSKDSYAEQYAQDHSINYFIFGDADQNREVNILDVTAIQRYKIGEQELSEYGMRCADVNHDGQITVRDATLIQMKLAKYDVDF